MTLPRRHTSAMSFGIAQRSGFGVDLGFLFADVGLMQDTESLGVRCHQPVFYPVMDHLDEMPGAVWAAVQITQFGSTTLRCPPRSSGNVSNPWSQLLKDGIEPLHNIDIEFRSGSFTAWLKPRRFKAST